MLVAHQQVGRVPEREERFLDSKADKSDPYTPSNRPYIRTVQDTGTRTPRARTCRAKVTSFAPVSVARKVAGTGQHSLSRVAGSGAPGESRRGRCHL